MPLYDTNYSLASGVTITATANGSDVSLAAAGALEGLRNGLINMAVLRFTGLIDSASADETLDVKIQEKIGSNYRDIGKFKQIGSAEDTNAEFQSSGDLARCFFTVSLNATHLRYVATVGGTTPSYAGMEIVLTPTNAGVPW